MAVPSCLKQDMMLSWAKSEPWIQYILTDVEKIECKSCTGSVCDTSRVCAI
jgi:hypothetical protein